MELSPAKFEALSDREKHSTFNTLRFVAKERLDKRILTPERREEGYKLIDRMVGKILFR